jgi:hypothetical protein
MDPYLEEEKFWPKFQHRFVQCLCQALLPSLGERYRAGIGHRHFVTEQALFTSVWHEEHHEEYAEVRLRSDERWVTLVEIVSPANRTLGAARQAYLDTRQASRMGGANVVEIDLILQGQPTLEYARDRLPAWDYAVTVTRASQGDRHEVYTTTLQKKLPRFRLPLAADDRETLIDLQALITRCYDQEDFGACIDYQRDPLTTLTDDQRGWLQERLRQQKRR